LDVVVEPSLTPGNLRAEEASLWRYRDAIPVEDEKAIVSLGEGMTPLLEAVLDGVRILLKAEYLSPTGSFKDRGASVLLSRLKEMRVEEILEDSSGNAGCSMAAYAAAAGIKCRVLVPENVPQEKAIQIASYGAILERIPGSRDDVAEEALRRSGEIFYASHNWQPFFLQGTKTFAYEIFEQAQPLPDVIFYPVGNGSLILGSLKGFSEMKALGWIDEIPRLIGVQVVSHAPVYTRVTGDKPQSVGDHTIAKGIAVRKPVRLQQIADAIRSTAGTVVTIEDSQIRVAQRDLARAGFLVEPTSATALAGYRVWKEGGEEGERVLLPLTGWGLKDIVSLEELSDEEAG
jgi:threonine synthase